jgi:hypothetical protein
MKTTIHTYRFDVRDEKDAKAYAALCQRMKVAGIKRFETWGGGSHYRPELDGKVLDLETKHLFANQWNTAPIEGVSEKGLRVFDWAQDYPVDFPQHIKRGHYLDITSEMTEARSRRHKCGYCGHQTDEPASDGFCDQCLDSQYLEVRDLDLLRMQPVKQDGKQRPPLTDDEAAAMLQRYKTAQTHGSTARCKARLAKQRKDIQHKRDITIDNANTEADGMLWLLDHGLNIDNVIYYKHTGRFAFGWRKPIDDALHSDLMDVLVEFPFDYDVKRA